MLGGGGRMNPNDAMDGLTSTTVQAYGELNVEALKKIQQDALLSLACVLHMHESDLPQQNSTRLT